MKTRARDQVTDQIPVTALPNHCVPVHRRSKLSPTTSVAAVFTAEVEPALMAPATSAPLSIAVGGQEIGGFKDQHRIIAQAWPKHIGADIPCPGDNHFSILESFADPKSELYQATMRMMDVTY